MFYDDYGAMDRWEDSNPVLSPSGAPGPALYGLGMDEEAAQAMSNLAAFPSYGLENVFGENLGVGSGNKFGPTIDLASKQDMKLKSDQITQAIKTTGDILTGITNAFANVETGKQRAELEKLYRENQLKQQRLINLQRQLQQQSTFVKSVTSPSTWIILVATGVILLGGAFVIGKGR